MKKTEIVKRYTLFLIGLFFIALGIAFTKAGELGVSPISSVPNVLSIKFTSISMGNWLMIWNSLLVIGQLVILRRNFKPILLLQFPLNFLFGYFTDFGMWCVSPIPVENYPMQLLMVVIGVVVLGFGIALSVIADVIMNAGEMFVKVLSDTTHKNFGDVKIAFDIFNVSLSVVISMLLFSGQIVGAREGTVIAMLGTGIVVKFFTKRMTKPINKKLSSN